VTEVAIQEAVDQASDGAVIHICGGHYTMIASTISISAELTLKAAGSAILDGGATVSADGTWMSGGRPIVSSANDLSVVGLTFTHAYGSALLVFGRVSVIRATFSYNSAVGSGAIGADTASIVASRFVFNTSTGCGGGAISASVLFTRNSLFTHNRALNCGTGFDLDQGGGAIYAEKEIHDSHSTFVLNSTDGQGGAVYAGEYNDGFNEFIGSRFTRNSAEGGGGAIATDSGSVTIRRARFVRNSTLGWGGVMLLNTDSGPNYCDGGGLYCDLSVRGSLFRGNKAPRHQGNILVTANSSRAKIRFIANIMQAGPRDAVISSAAHVRGMPFKIQELPN
jgi:hypothetical protein